LTFYFSADIFSIAVQKDEFAGSQEFEDSSEKYKNVQIHIKKA